MVDGTMYVTGPWSMVHAIDARTARGSGRTIRRNRRAGLPAMLRCRQSWCRGLQGQGVSSGRPTEANRTRRRDRQGAGRIDTLTDRFSVPTRSPARRGSSTARSSSATAAPNWPVRGYVSAYRRRDRQAAWRWYTVPGDPAKGFENKAMDAAKTWKGQWWKYGGGGTAWNAMTYDPDYNRVYIGTGNGGPWSRKLRSPGGGTTCSCAPWSHWMPTPGSTCGTTRTPPARAGTITSTRT